MECWACMKWASHNRSCGRGGSSKRALMPGKHMQAHSCRQSQSPWGTAGRGCRKGLPPQSFPSPLRALTWQCSSQVPLLSAVKSTVSTEPGMRRTWSSLTPRCSKVLPAESREQQGAAGGVPEKNHYFSALLVAPIASPRARPPRPAPFLRFREEAARPRHAAITAGVISSSPGYNSIASLQHALCGCSAATAHRASGRCADPPRSQK